MSAPPFPGILDLYQGNDFNPQKCWDEGIRLVIHKAGRWNAAVFHQNQLTYASRKAAWLALGGEWGSYFLPFANEAAPYAIGKWLSCEHDSDILRAIDWEDDGSGETASQDTVALMAKDIARLFGRLPLIYGSSTLTERGPDSTIDACPLWYANPTGESTPPQTFSPSHPPRGDLRFWQWTGDDGAPQFDGADLNVYNGTEEELMAWLP